MKGSPNRSVTAARKANYGTYQFLRKYDRKWIFSQNKKTRQIVNWAARDAQWSLLLQKTAENIKAATPPRRAAKTVIVKEARLNLRVLNELQLLPKCQQILQQHGETSEEFRKRDGMKNEFKGKDVTRQHTEMRQKKHNWCQPGGMI